MSSATYSPVDIAIVGGGIIGCTLAWELARRGSRVAIIERGSIGGEASWASAGIISPPSIVTTQPDQARLTARSILAYPEFIAAIEEETGADVGWRLRGEIIVAQNDDEMHDLAALADWHEGLGFNSEILDADAVRELEPVLPERTAGGLLTHEAGNLVVYRLTRTVASAAQRRGVRIIEHTPAMGVETEGGRATGVRLPDGVLPAGQVILAAGAWTAQFGLPLGQELPTVPVKGQMLALNDAPIMPSRVIFRYGWGYIVPRTDGTIAVGATKERVGFDKRVTAGNIRWCLDLIEDIAPALMRGEVVANWAGLRPGTIDDLPILGPVPGYDQLWVATGHYSTGVQMAIGTAEVMADAILAGQSDPMLDAFSPTRFGTSSG